MGTPPNKHDHLWNNMPKKERERLLPHAMESQLLHIWQCKQMAIKAHQRHMKELNEWMENIKRDLVGYDSSSK